MAVGGQHDLLGALVERVEGVEELLLEALLAFHELDVVDQQDVAVAVAALEDHLAVVADGVDEVVHEGLGRDVADAHAGEVLHPVVADGVQEVGLPQAGVAVDEQRVVAGGGGLGDPLGGGVGEPVGRSDDEGVEGVAGVEDGRLAPETAPAGAPAGAVTAPLASGRVEPSARSSAGLGGESTPEVRRVGGTAPSGVGRTTIRTAQVASGHLGHHFLQEWKVALLQPIPHQ